MLQKTDITDLRSHIRHKAVGPKQYWEEQRGQLAHLPIHKDRHDMQADVLRGLKQNQKAIPFKYFYDLAGSQLFEQITQQPEYYLTRAEEALLQEHASRIGEELGQSHSWVELGSGSSRKTRHLLSQWCRRVDCAHYLPVDISHSTLVNVVPHLLTAFKPLWVSAVHADYNGILDLLQDRPQALPVSILFLGSNIGNFSEEERRDFFRQVAKALGDGSTFAFGADLAKDRSTLEAAYNDQAGVTARFNRNILYHLKRALHSEVDPEQFEHRAIYDEARSRVVMSLVSRGRQTIRLGDEIIVCEDGESIHTEDSAKFAIAPLTNELEQCGLQVFDIIKDSRDFFSFWICMPISPSATAPRKSRLSRP